MDTQKRRGKGSSERWVFFSDGVCAIAITLLAIDLPVPSGGSDHAFYLSIQNNSGRYVAFIVSFLIVAFAWRNHNSLHSIVRRADSRFVSLNLVWLLTVVLLPFAAKLLTIHRHAPRLVHAYCFGFYALLETASSLTIIFMLRHAQRNGDVEDGTSEDAAHLRRSCAGLVFGFGASVPLFFVTTFGWITWILGPLVNHLARQAGATRQGDVA
jgi:uncharacterized membrane protein